MWEFPSDMNKCYISLIPKFDNPDVINQFRPITLCDVIYKVVTKILVDRLRPFLVNIVCPQLAIFLPGHQTTDNIIMTREIVHSLKKKEMETGRNDFLNRFGESPSLSFLLY